MTAPTALQALREARGFTMARYTADRIPTGLKEVARVVDVIDAAILAEEADMETREALDRFYIDCEFDGHNGPLLSLAIVGDDTRSVHIRTHETARDPWVISNVVPIMDHHEAPASQWIPLNAVGESIRKFFRNVAQPVIVADSPVDIGRFCTALSTGEDGGWISTDYQKMTFEVYNVDCYPTDLPGAVQHNAWWDAMALRHLLRARFLASRGGG